MADNSNQDPILPLNVSQMIHQGIYEIVHSSPHHRPGMCPIRSLFGFIGLVWLPLAIVCFL